MRVPSLNVRARRLRVLLMALLGLGVAANAQTSQPQAAPGAATTDPPAASANASAPQASAPAAKPAPANASHRCDLISSLPTCLDDVWHDQIGMWTSPARIHRGDAIWLLPVATGAAIAFRYDSETMAAVGSAHTRVSNDFTTGSAYALIGASLGSYALGKFTHNERARETGMLALEALGDAGIVAQALKFATDRFRPNSGAGAGIFWPDGPSDKGMFTTNGSFPSGHATATWAFMHVLAEETPGHKWLHLGMYALAGAVSVGRVTGRNHFPSDVVVGSALGYLIGGYVYRHNSQYANQTGPSIVLAPISDPVSHTYGINLALIR